MNKIYLTLNSILIFIITFTISCVFFEILNYINDIDYNNTILISMLIGISQVIFHWVMKHYEQPHALNLLFINDK